MKKIIIALDGNHFPHGAFEFAKYLNLENDVLLAGVFLSPVDYSKLLLYSGAEAAAMMPGWFYKDDDDQLVLKNIALFTEACTKEGIGFRIHKDNNGMAIASLVEETRFADVLLVSSELFYKNVSELQPNFYLEEVLKKSECPVVLVPESFTPPKQNVIAYDGSESAVFAMKQFAYLFPQLAAEETVLLSVNATEKNELEEYSLVTELAAGHYPNLRIEMAAMANRHNFTVWLAEQPPAYVIMGAYSRGLFSSLFKKSFAAGVIQEVEMPVFIAHK
jgi:nucleotide-binding universal stress UspA family protein